MTIVQKKESMTIVIKEKAYYIYYSKEGKKKGLNHLRYHYFAKSIIRKQIC